jgi:hypothetical protein
MRAGCLLFFFICLCSVAASGQSILFKTVFGSEPVRWNHQEYRSSNGEKIRFSDFSFYLSEFSWYQGSEKAIHEHQRVELLRADAEKDSMRISGPLKSDRICFRFGLDSATQVSGRTDGALDPALGMYWAWNTGYIQCRLEGYSPESKGKKGKFEFHLGGYATPYSTSFKMCIDLSSGAENPVIQVNLKPLMDAVPLNKKWSVLTPGAEAWELSRLIGNSFQSAAVK